MKQKGIKIIMKWLTILDLLCFFTGVLETLLPWLKDLCPKIPISEIRKLFGAYGRNGVYIAYKKIILNNRLILVVDEPNYSLSISIVLHLVVISALNKVTAE